MRNGADIAYRENILLTMTNTLDRIHRGTHTGREIENGVKMAIEYIKSLKGDRLTKSELYHAVRLANFRGRETDYRNIITARGTAI